MAALVTSFAGSLLLYMLICAISVAAGLGLLRLIGLEIRPRSALVLAPVFSLTFWAIGLGIGVALRIPVRFLAAPLWILTCAGACYEVSRLVSSRRAAIDQPRHGTLGLVRPLVGSSAPISRRAARRFLHVSWPLALCVVLPIGIFLPYFVAGPHNYVGSILPDGWSYVAYGQYLWHYPRGAEGGLAPLYQYAAHVSTTRYISSSLLAFFSPLFSAGDTQMATGLLLAWLLFAFAAACTFFSLTMGLRLRLLPIYLLVTLCSGWIYNLFWANNYDNALALIFFPALIGSIISLDPSAWSWRIALGLLGAGLLYSYPELALFVLGGAFLVLVNRWWSERQARRAWMLTAGGGLIIALLLIAPFFREMASFVFIQIASGIKSGPRPGEGLFVGLRLARYEPSAFWGLGGEHRSDSWIPGGVYPIEAWLPVRNVVGGLLSVLAAAGLVRLVRRRYLGLALLTVLLVVGALVVIIQMAYSYGAYKLILLSWWLLSFAVIQGLDALRPHLRGWRGPAAAVFCALIFLGMLPFEHYTTPSRQSSYKQLGMSEFRALEQIKPLVGEGKLMVAVDDWLANEWAVYFLRDVPLRLSSYRMYMDSPHLVRFMDRARSIPLEEVRYILTDANFSGSFSGRQPWQLVWSGGPYRLWNPGDGNWAMVTTIRNPNGIEYNAGKQFFWLGEQAATLEVLARQEGLFSIRATFHPGPSVAGRAERDLVISTDHGFRDQISVSKEDRVLLLPISRGVTHVTLQALDRVTTTSLPRGETRALILGVSGMTTGLNDALTVIERIENPNGIEQLDHQEFFWMGQGATTIHVRSLHAGRLRLTGQFLLGPGLPGVKTRRLLVTSSAGEERTLTLTEGEQSIELPVEAGATTITLTPLDRATVTRQPNGDTRPLIVGVKGLGATLVAP